MLSSELAVLQAAMFDGLSLDPFTLFDDGLGPAEVGVGGGDIRHKIYAHRGLEDEAEEQALYAQTNINEIVSLLAFLSSLNDALWEALNNGRQPDLARKGPEFPIPDRSHRNCPGERVYLETVEALGFLSQGANRESSTGA